MSLRDPFEKCLRSVVAQMKTQSNDMMLLEHRPHGAQFLYHGKVYLLDFPESEPENLLFPQVYEYQVDGRRVVFDREPVHQFFCEAYQRALFDYLKKVALVGNTKYLCEAYATYFLSHYKDIMSA